MGKEFRVVKRASERGRGGAPSATKLQTAKEAETESIQRQTNAKGKFRLLGGVTKGCISVFCIYICSSICICSTGSGAVSMSQSQWLKSENHRELA